MFNKNSLVTSHRPGPPRNMEGWEHKDQEVSTSGGEVGGKKNTVNTHKTRCNEGANEDRRVGISSKKWHGFEVRADLGSKPVSSNS